MQKRLKIFLNFILLFSIGCQTEPEMSPLEASSTYFGLSNETRCFERNDGVLENWDIKTMVQGEAYWQYLITATSNGFVTQDRSLTLRVKTDGLFLESWHDCSSSCLKPEPIVQMWSNPIYARERNESVVKVNETLGAISEEYDETHVFFVGESKEISVLGGSEEGFDIQWIRTRGDDISTNTLTFVPQRGLVAWVDDTGTELTLIECTE